MVMKLSDYMKSKGLNDERMAALIGRHRVTVTRYRNGQVRPDWKALAAIIDATNGAVRPEDFLSCSQTK